MAANTPVDTQVEKRSCSAASRKRQGEAPMALKFFLSMVLVYVIGAVPASAAVEQCRFIQARPEREACYQRQEAELAAKRKPEPASDTTKLDSLKQMREEDDAVYKSMRGICRGC
jgi:hypothetical protein